MIDNEFEEIETIRNSCDKRKIRLSIVNEHHLLIVQDREYGMHELTEYVRSITGISGGSRPVVISLASLNASVLAFCASSREKSLELPLPNTRGLNPINGDCTAQQPFRRTPHPRYSLGNVPPHLAH